MPAEHIEGKLAAAIRGTGLLLSALWVGGLWAVGYLAAPVLFATLEDRQLAGFIAGRMFTLIGYFGFFAGSCLLLLALAEGRQATRLASFRITALMMAIGMAAQFGIQPMLIALKSQALPLDVMQSALASRFKALHGISQMLYLLQSLLGLLLIIKTKRC